MLNGGGMIVMFLDIFLMIIEESEDNEINLKLDDFGLAVDGGGSKRENVLMKFQR